MWLLTDVHVKTAYLTALRGEGHEVVRVVDTDSLGEQAVDAAIIEHAREIDAVVLTNDVKDFDRFENHPGVIVVPQAELTAGEVALAVSRIERSVPNCSDLTLYATDWV